MERIGFLINKLKEQYEKADNQDNMLVTLQMLYKELMPKIDNNTAFGKISVMVPGQMDLTYLEKNMAQKLALDLVPSNTDKQVFELSIEPNDEAKKNDKQLAATNKPVEKPLITVVSAPKNPFVVIAPKIENAAANPDPVSLEKPKEEPAEASKTNFAGEVNNRFMPQELKPANEPPATIASVLPPLPDPAQAPKNPSALVPPKEVHESIKPDLQPSLNDRVEKKQPELFHVLKAEPLKDLKKAISINERFQYINHLFMKDESMYDRSLKTINNFNVLSEANFWIRKELAIKMGWRDDDEVVQQFMHLVERRFL